MKKLFATAILLSALSVPVGAQTIYDAYSYSNNSYGGTARTIAMGNAFTALGGDIGSVGINPAGSAVNPYSQAVITPGLSVVSSNSQYASTQGGSYDSAQGENKVRMTMPNIGVSLYYPTGNAVGIKGVSVGLVINSSSNFLDYSTVSGQNAGTSFLAYLASVATYEGYDGSYNYGSKYSWPSVVAYNSGMISSYGGYSNRYVGATQNIYSDDSGNCYTVPEPASNLNQTYGRRNTGYKYDLVLNAAINISDKIYVGVNLGMVYLDMTSNSYFKEGAVVSSEFENSFDSGTTYFNSAVYRYKYSATGEGVYGKLGVIVLPLPGLRLGAAIQTPTFNLIEETWRYSGETNYSDSSYDGYATSDKGNYRYELISPFRANFGAAYVGRKGVLSVDYELCNYGSMEFRDEDSHSTSSWTLENQLISKFYGVQHNLRVGAELLLPKGLSVRAGYTLQTSPECYWYDSYGPVDASVYEEEYYSDASDEAFYSWANSLSGKTYVKANTHSASIGAGYSSKSSFFADVACRCTFRPYSYYYPYSTYYTFDADGNETYSANAPEIRSKSKLWDVVVTFGWRF